MALPVRLGGAKILAMNKTTYKKAIVQDLGAISALTLGSDGMQNQDGLAFNVNGKGVFGACSGAPLPGTGTQVPGISCP